MVPSYDQLSTLSYYWQIYLLLHRQFLMIECIIAGSVPVYDTRLSCYSKVLIIYHIYLALDR
jgi:hypothetical protein